jgi:signal transduction histidine kinase
VLVFVALLLAGAVWTGHLLRTTTVDAAARSEELARLDDVLVRVLGYRRVADLEAASPHAELAPTRALVRGELFAALREAEAAAATPAERARLRQASEAVHRYVDEREATRSAASPELGTQLDHAMALVAGLRAEKRAELLRTNRAAYEATLVSDLVSFGGVVVLAVVAVIAMRYLGSMVMRPLVAIESCIERYRRGDREARAPVEGAHELGRVASAFNEMAQALESQRDRELTFLAGVAHDLRNPLSAIRLGVHTVRDGHLSAAARERTLSLLDRQVDRLSRIVTDLLDATRIEAGRLQLDVQHFDLREIVRDVVGLYTPTSTSHDIRVDAPREPVWVDADPVRIEQVLANLVSNAVKFSPKGGRIDVRLRHDPEEVRLEVGDRGIGIAPAALETIFLPFHRTAPDIAPGTGLGLSVVRHIVEAHAGRIEVLSELGRGSTFRVRLPAPSPA